MPCHTAGPVTASGPALDASGYWMDLYTNDYTVKDVRGPEGTVFYGSQPGDTNGNYVTTSSGDLVDTLNRTPAKHTTVSGTETDYAVQTSQGASTFKVFWGGCYAKTAFGQSGVSEYNGTTGAPVSSIQLPDGTSYIMGYDCGYPTATGYALLQSLQLPAGDSLSFSFMTFADAQGNRNRWLNTFSAMGGTWTYAPSTGCGANCQTVTVTRPSNDQTVYTFNLNNGAWNTQTKYYTGSSTSGTLLETVQNDYDYSLSNPVTGGAGFIRRIRSTATFPTPGGSAVKKTEYAYDTFTYNCQGTNYSGSRGKLTSQSEYAYGSGGPGGLIRQTLYSYLDDSNPSYASLDIVNRVTDAKTLDGGGAKRSETLTSYDSTSLTSVTGITHHDDTNYGAGFTTRGNATAIERWTGSAYLSTTLNYDTTGQALNQTDPAGNLTSFSYADNFYVDNGLNPPSRPSPTPPATNAYMTAETLPVSGSLTFGFYYGSGKRALAADQNAATTYYHFQDSLDRPTFTNPPLGGTVQTTYPSATERDHYFAVAGGTRQQQVLLDTMVRPIHGNLVNDPLGEVYKDKSYDPSGRVQTRSNPYRSTGDPTYGTDTYAYDGLSRVLSVAHSDTSTAYTYYGAAVSGAGGAASQLCSAATYGVGYPVLSVDENGKKRQSWTDAMGRVIEVDEPDSSNSLTVGTCYKYDTLDNLIEVDQGSETRRYSYDALSRLTLESTPEGGTVSLSYTASGGSQCSGNPSLVCGRTDARGITTTYTYDALNRLTGKSYSNGDHSVSYFYDQTSYNGLTITNGLGRRTGMSDASGQTAWSYDVEGHVLTEKRTIAGVTETLSYTYNRDGSFASITYPNGNLVTYQYDAVGRPYSAQARTFSYVTSATYTAPETPDTVSISGAAWNYTYNSRLQIATDKFTWGSTTLANLGFNYVGGNNGNIANVTDYVTSGRTQYFTYDTLNRVATAYTSATSGPDCWGQSFGYDRYGNLTTVNVTLCSAPMLSLTVNTNNQIANTGFNYDASGDLTSDGVNNYTWNAEALVAAANSVNYTYDGDRKRVKKSDGTLYWYDPNGNVLEETGLSGNLLHDYIYFGGKRIARQDGTGATSVYYFFGDHLGTALVMVDAWGHVQQQSVYYPFGGERVITNTVANHYRFTGLERDSESGLDHTLFRQYSSNFGRWLSPEPAAPDITDPQSLNRYAYVGNNPLTLIDPSGLIGYCPYGQTGGVCNGPPFFGPSGGVFPPGSCSTVLLDGFYFSDSCGGDAGRNMHSLGAGDRSDSKPDRGQLSINRAVKAVLKALKADQCCINFLDSGGHDVLDYFQGFVDNPDLVGHARIPISGGSITNAETPGIDGQIITVNDIGAFFHSSVMTPAGPAQLNVGGITGGTPKAQALILLHEAGHAMGVFGANDNDVHDTAKSAANDKAIEDHCQQTLSQFK